jgi:hypothetical protein
MNVVHCKICEKEVGVKGMAEHLKLHSIPFILYVSEHIEDGGGNGARIVEKFLLKLLQILKEHGHPAQMNVKEN